MNATYSTTFATTAKTKPENFLNGSSLLNLKRHMSELKSCSLQPEDSSHILLSSPSAENLMSQYNVCLYQHFLPQPVTHLPALIEFTRTQWAPFSPLFVPFLFSAVRLPKKLLSYSLSPPATNFYITVSALVKKWERSICGRKKRESEKRVYNFCACLFLIQFS